MQRKQAVILIEVKAEENLKAKKFESLCRTVSARAGNSFFHGRLSGTGLAGECAVVCLFGLSIKFK